ncbi:MAG TPA: T9SS type A sorting domain-containing protein, partial [Bacteroidia bacterium]|nr:T9SS type A sorting domain-containing protein [Bacteroidia bacterium]
NANAAWIRICTPETPSISIFPISDFCTGTVTIGSTLQFAGNIPYIKWYINGTHFPFNGDTITLSGLSSNDTILAKLWSNSACSILDSVSSNAVIISGILPSINYSWPELIATTGTSYQWYLDSLPIPGATNQSYVPLTNGNYQVEVTFASGCSQLSLDYPFIFTGQSSPTSTQIKVYPNPSKGKFKIETSEGNKSIIILDCTGRNLLQFNTKEKSFTIDISDKFSSGIYFLTVRLGENIYYERIVVQQ